MSQLNSIDIQILSYFIVTKQGKASDDINMKLIKV